MVKDKKDKNLKSPPRGKRSSPRSWLVILFSLFFFLVLSQFFWETTLQAWRWFKGKNTYTYQVEDSKY